MQAVISCVIIYKLKEVLNVRLNNPKKPRESKVMKYVNLAGSAIMLNLIFLVACLPVVTIGPALSGLYSGVRYMIRGEGPAQGFWEGFKTNFLRMMVAGVIFTAILFYFAVMLNGAYNTWLELGIFRDVVAYAIPAMVPLMLLAALVPLNIYIPYSPVEWLKNGVNLVVKAPLWVLLSGLMLAAPVFCFLFASDIFILGMTVFLGFWSTIAAFVSTLVLKSPLVDMLMLYREEHPEDDEEYEENGEE